MTQPGSLIGEEWERNIADGYDVVAHFDDVPQEVRLWAWAPERGLRDAVLARLGSYKEETRMIILRMLLEADNL